MLKKILLIGAVVIGLVGSKVEYVHGQAVEDEQEEVGNPKTDSLEETMAEMEQEIMELDKEHFLHKHKAEKEVNPWSVPSVEKK